MIVHHPLHDHATVGGRSCNRWWIMNVSGGKA
jgi:hypothetical protein